jgi:hypothetical protein
MGTGVVNQFSIVDINNDTAFIDQTGIKSFNAVKQYRWEGNSTPFSSTISALFKVPGEQDNIIQNVCCAHSTNNYSLFSMDTIYGPALVIYDMLRTSFTAIDQYFDTPTKIKQFAELKMAGSRYLYFITDTNELYELFGSDEYANCQIYIGEYCSQDPMTGQKPQTLSLCFTNIYEGGNLSASLYVDQMLVSTKTGSIVSFNELPIISPSTFIPIPFPDFHSSKSQALNLSFQQESRTGWKSGFLVSWNFNAALSIVHLSCKDDTSKVPFQQQVTINNQYVPQVGTPIFK